ncbi:argininosuccinate synthase [Candidatus Bathyarchaeota archaeon]|jgi:argininosuccinate synthase|nr:argininosuccinate synthase [Candidatus Bathyarchaeota archaeon]
MVERAVLAYSGGLDTSVAVPWIKEKYDLDVVTVTVNVGQGDDFQAIEQKALKSGAARHYSIDVRDEFAEEFVFAGIKANALYGGKYPLSTALARPLIVSKLVEIARKEGAVAAAHGCTGKGNDQVRFDVGIKALASDLKIVAPIREWNMTRAEEMRYAKEKGIPVPVDLAKPYSIDQNLFGRSIESGVLEDASREPPSDIYEWTVSPEKAPNEPEYLEIEFSQGVPVAVNGTSLNPVKLIESLNAIAGRHGVGRVDHLEDRLVGIKSREIYECPAAAVLLEAHSDLEKAVMTRHELSFKQQVDQQWSFLVYTGLWYDPLREDLDAFIDETQKRVTGNVRMKLYKGLASVVGRSSPMSLYDANLATYEAGSKFDQRWSSGFIEIWGLPTTVAYKMKAKAQLATSAIPPILTD